MELELDKAGKQNADLLNEKVGHQAKSAPVKARNTGAPTRRTREGYADDYHALSERLVEVSHAQEVALAQVKALEGQIESKDAELRRVKAQRLNDLDRLAAVSRTRDVLEKRSSAQMAKVAAALARPGATSTRDAQQRDPAEPRALGLSLGEQPDEMLGWAQRRWWNTTIKAAQKAHREVRLDDAQAAFELALRTRQTASLWEQLGHVLREAGRFDEAELAYGRSLRLRPGNAELLFLSGYCLEMEGRGDEAVRQYEAALAGDPDLAQRYDHLRDFHARQAR